MIGSDGVASGGAYVHVPEGTGDELGPPPPLPGSRADLCFTVAAAGDYQIQGWVYTDPVGGYSDSFFVTVDGQPGAGYLWDVQENTQYLADLVNDRNGSDPVVVTLSAGQHIVSVYHREDGARLDRLELIPIGGPANQPPVVTNPGNQANNEGEGVTLNIVASDPDGDVLTFSASGLPAGLTINASSGQISGTLPAGSTGLYTVTVTADDGNGGTDSVTFTWTVNGPANQPPVVTNPGNQANDEGDGVTLNIVASDPDGDVLTFSASGLPPGLTINPNSGQIAGTLTFESAGVHNVTVTVSDGTAGTSLSFRWTVNDVKRASKDDDDDDEDDDNPPPDPPPASQVSAPSVASAPTPSVLYLPETGIGGYSEPGPTVWPVIALPGLGILLGWAIYHNLNKRHE